MYWLIFDQIVYLSARKCRGPRRRIAGVSKRAAALLLALLIGLLYADGSCSSFPVDCPLSVVEFVYSKDYKRQKLA